METTTFLGKDIFEGVKVIPMTFESYPDQARGMIEEDIFLDHSCLER